MKLKALHAGVLSAILATSALAADPSDSQRLFDEMDCELGDCCKQNLEKSTMLLKSLRESIKPLKDKYASCQSQLSQLDKKQSQISALEKENNLLKAQLSKGSKTATTAANFALYSKQLEGKVSVLNEQVSKLEANNQKLTQQIETLKVENARLAQAKVAPAAPVVAKSAPAVAVAKPVPVATAPAPKIPAAQIGGKIVGSLLSMKRETSGRKGTDQIVLGISLTNTTNKTIFGVLVGPEITAIDDNNNMFATKYSKHTQGITKCEYAHLLYNEMGWCEDQIKNSKISTTSFRPGVPVNLLASIPAINSDPDKKSNKVNTTLFLLLETEEKGVYEKFPVDIRQ